MNDYDTIKLGTGIGELKFGATQDQVREYLGEPEEIAEDGDEGDLTITWYYWTCGISVCFDQEDDFRFSTCETASPAASIGGQCLLGLNIDEALTALESAKLGEPNQTDEYLELDGGGKMTLFEYPEKGLNLWFEENILTEIQWYAIIDENDQVIWPA